MIKNFLAIVALALIFVSCGNNAAEEKVNLTVDQTLEQIQDLVDSTITLEGTVVHICQHGGGKMFLVGENPDAKLKVVAGDVVTMFDRELEGSDVIIEGIVLEQRIDEAYLVKWEEELKAKIAADTLAADTLEEVAEKVEEEVAEEAEEVADETEEVAEEEDHHVEDADPHHGDPFEKINELRKELEESGKEYLSFYSIECVKVTVKEIEEGDDNEVAEGEEHEHAEGEEHDHDHNH